MKKVMITLSLLFVFALSFSQSFQVGNKVEVYNSGAWYKASIVQVGSGNYEGYYYVDYDQYSQNQWIRADNIRPVKTSVANTASGPRNGTYVILSYGSPSNPIRLGYFDLKGGHYIYYNLNKKQIGSGDYSYDPNSKSISWKSGPFREAKWNGAFEVDREGKTHKIRLNSVTIGSNSTDAN